MSGTGRAAGGSFPGARWVRPWVQIAEITVSVPVVVGYRVTRMAVGGWPPSRRDRRELVRMVQEKAEAFGQAAVAAVTTPPRDTAALVGNVLAPVHRTVVGNRRRLARH